MPAPAVQADVIVSNDCHVSRWKVSGVYAHDTSPNLGLAWLHS